MGLSYDCRERRRWPRKVIKLPVHFETTDNSHSATGLAIDASQAGLLLQTFLEMRVGTRVFIKISHPQVREVLGFNIRSEAEVIWKDICAWEDWEAYQYGLKFICPERNLS